MESKIMRDLSRCNTSLLLMSLAFLNDFSEKEALEILKECVPKTKHLLKIIQNTPIEEIKKADDYLNVEHSRSAFGSYFRILNSRPGA